MTCKFILINSWSFIIYLNWLPLFNNFFEIFLCCGEEIIFSPAFWNAIVELLLLYLRFFSFSFCSLFINFSYFEIVEDFKEGKESVFSLNLSSFKKIFNEDKYLLRNSSSNIGAFKNSYLLWLSFSNSSSSSSSFDILNFQ